MMKRKFGGMLLCIFVLFLLPALAYETGSTVYQLDELGLSISFPSNYVIFTRNIDTHDPNLSVYGLTKSSMSSHMVERNIYLDGWDRDVNQEITVTMIDSLITDFNLLGDTVLSTLATSLISEYANMGFTVSKSEIYQHSQAKFLKIYVSQPDGDSMVYRLQYYTVYDNKAINIILQSYLGQISSSQESTLKGIIDSAAFNTQPHKAENMFQPTTPFTYTDPKTQTTFTVPANWVQVPLSKNRDTIDVKFSSLEEPGMTMMYGSLDMWSKMSTLERIVHNRSDIDNSFVSKSELAEALELSVNDISTVTYADNEYFVYTVTGNTESYGTNFSITMTHMLTCRNGYMYLFQFNGATKNAFFEDFESLLASVKLAN